MFACEVSAFLRDITTLKNMPTPLFEEPIEFITHGWIMACFTNCTEEDTFEEEQRKSAKILAADTVCAKSGLRFIIHFDKSHVL